MLLEGQINTSKKLLYRRKNVFETNAGLDETLSTS
jgi:hypothetical protein